MNWTTDCEALAENNGLRCRLLRDGEDVTYEDVVGRWQSDPDFVDAFVRALADAQFHAFYFETPPISQRIPDVLFEFVLIDAPSLAGVTPEPRAFEEHFKDRETEEGIAVFPNLGGDAMLVAPCPAEPLLDYSHLAVFTREAPRRQQHALWRRVGEAATEWLRSDDPVWISTSGLEVFWLHVRLDRYPKYYNHAPYRRWQGG